MTYLECILNSIKAAPTLKDLSEIMENHFGEEGEEFVLNEAEEFLKQLEDEIADKQEFVDLLRMAIKRKAELENQK